MVLTDHKHVERRGGKPDGEPVVAGTGIRVRALIEYRQLGRTDEEIIEDFYGLTPAIYYDALSFAYENMEEIEGWIRLNRYPDPAGGAFISRPGESPQAFLERISHEPPERLP